jgi:hypothetical protein
MGVLGLQGRGKPPGAAILTCRQCELKVNILLSWNDGSVRVTYQDPTGSVATKNTPREVAYYLDEAARCISVGARSAATAMFRSALEHVLHDQGYAEGMLDSKIKALEKEIEAKTPRAAAWSKMDTEVLMSMKSLGNGAIHPNGGDVSLQATLDAGLISTLEIVFESILREVYEEPAERAERAERLKQTAALFKKT